MSARKFGFAFSNLCADNLSQGEQTCLTISANRLCSDSSECSSELFFGIKDLIGKQGLKYILSHTNLNSFVVSAGCKPDFPNEYVKLRSTITQGCLFIQDQKFQEQLQCLQIVKTKSLVTFFKVRNDFLMNLGKTLDKFQKYIQESSGFSFSNLFADDQSQGELICLLVS